MTAGAAPLSPGVRQAGWALAGVVAPAVLTATLVRLGEGQSRDYVFLYMGLVAVLGLVAGLVPSLASAAASFLLVDWFFVPPHGTLTISNGQDIINLVVFFGTAGIVGALGSIRRRSLIRTQQLAAQLGAANAELIRLNQEQAEAAEVELRLARTEQQVRALQENEREQRQLIANVSHDLRTPLGTILTASTGLLQRSDLGPDVRDRLETVASEARRLNHLVANTLDLARIDAGVIKLDLETVSLGEAVALAVERLHRTSPDRRVDFDEAGQPNVMADWGRLAQVLDNLLNNADRHSPGGAPIKVEVALAAPGTVTTRVVDQGPGLAPEIRDHLFERFVQPGGGGDGTGLGLAIVRGLVQAHGGEVVYADAPGGGACFSFTLAEG